MLNQQNIFSSASGFRDRFGASIRTRFAPRGVEPRTFSELFEPERRVERLGHVLLTVALALSLILVSIIAGAMAGSRARQNLERQMTADASIRASELVQELERYRALPYILSRDRDVIEALRSQDIASRARLSAKLVDISREANVGVLYVRGFLGQDAPPPDMKGAECGRLVAVVFPGGLNGNRYYCNVLGPGVYEGFARGGTDRPPGMYFARQIVVDGQRLGMVGTKAEFNELEKRWSNDKRIVFVTDGHGIVLLSSIPDWQFQTVSKLSAAQRADLTRSGRFRTAQLLPLPIDWRKDAEGLITIRVAGAEPEKFILSKAKLTKEGWTLNILTPASEPVNIAKYSAGLIVLFSGLLVLNMMRSLQRRRKLSAIEAAKQSEVRDELERRVNERTAELQAAGIRLQKEMDERRRVARKVNSLRDELVQANKLATLGQVTAGVAHEINQPVAAIKTYTESALVFLKRNQTALAEENLHRIEGLTEKISHITQELRSFSRRSTGVLESTDLSVAIDGALLLSSHRLTVQDIKVTRAGDSPKVSVYAERMRLEQVLVNLIQNAMDAMENSSQRVLTVGIEDRADDVAVHIQDTGSGLNETALKSLFLPFATTKPNGLGLGLVISRDIVSEFGGELFAFNKDYGACFTFTLRKSQ